MFLLLTWGRGSWGDSTLSSVHSRSHRCIHIVTWLISEKTYQLQ